MQKSTFENNELGLPRELVVGCAPCEGVFEIAGGKGEDSARERDLREEQRVPR